MGQSRELRTFRIILLICVVLTPLSALDMFKADKSFYDPLEFRLIFSFIYLLAIVASFTSKEFAKRYKLFIHIMVFMVTFYQLYLMHMNDYHRTHVGGLIFVSFLLILYIKDQVVLISYSLFTFLTMLLLFFVKAKVEYSGSSLELKDWYENHGVSFAAVRSIFIINLMFTLIRFYSLKRDKNLLKFSKKLDESEEKFKKLLESAPDGIAHFDQSGTILGFNRRMREIFGYEEEELIGQKIEKVIAEKSHSVHKHFIQTFINDPNARQPNVGRELHAIRKNGEEFPVEISFSAFFTDEETMDKQVNVVAIFRDISSRIAFERELNEVKQKLQEKELSEKISSAKSEFISKMSHEIRTPLNGIYGFTNLLLKEPLKEEQFTYLNNIKHSTKLLSMLINDVLDNTNFENDKITLKEEKIDIDELLAIIVSNFKVQLEHKNIKLDIRVDNELEAGFIADELRISQIIFNLLSNAIKFSFVKSDINLDIAIKKLDDQRCNFSLSITNSGENIPGDKLEEIFLPYVQANPEIAQKYGGTGLGLSIVKNLIDKYHGRIGVQSENNFTTFSLDFNLKAIVERSEVPSQECTIKEVKQGIHILVAEDNKMNQFLLKTILDKLQIKHEIVENGEEAVEAVKRTDYHIILMDLMMPVMDGITSSKIIKNDLGKNIPIVALTADVKKQSNEDQYTIFDAFIKKPFEEEDLLSTVYDLVK